MKDGEKFIVKCPVCLKPLAEMGIADGRLHYECLWGARIMRTRLEDEYRVKRRLMRTLESLADEAARHGHDHNNGTWSRQLAWTQILGAPIGDEKAEIFLSFRYKLAGDKLVPIDKKTAPILQLPEDSFETSDWEWTERNKRELTKEEAKDGHIKVGRNGKKK